MTETIGIATYISDFGADAVQVNQPSFPKRKEIYELATASMKYEGAPSRISDYADGLLIGDILEYLNQELNTVTLETMFLSSISQNEGAYNSELVLSFSGSLDGLEPPEEVEDGLVSQSVTTAKVISDASSPLDGVKVSMTIDYKAARTCYKWYRFTEPDPDVPEFTTTTNTTPPLDRPFSWKVSNADKEGLNTSLIDLADVVSVFSTLTAEVQFDDYRVKPLIPGKLWQCSVAPTYVLLGAV